MSMSIVISLGDLFFFIGIDNTPMLGCFKLSSYDIITVQKPSYKNQFFSCCPNWTQVCSHIDICYIPGPFGSLFAIAPTHYLEWQFCHPDMHFEHYSYRKETEPLYTIYQGVYISLTLVWTSFRILPVSCFTHIFTACIYFSTLILPLKFADQFGYLILTWTSLAKIQIAIFRQKESF